MNFRSSAICGPVFQAYIAAMAKGKVLSGTSGWSYKHWNGLFYPENIPDKSMPSF